MATKQTRSSKKARSKKQTAHKKATRPRTIQVVDDTVIADAPHEQPDLAVINPTRRLSAIDAAARVLDSASEPMSVKQLIEAMALQGYWSSPGGKTPSATLYSAILREIKTKGDRARFHKAERGRFTRLAQ